MTDIALQLEGVYKKFRRGEVYDSLRDLIPAVAKRMFRPTPRTGLAPREFWALQDVTFGVKRGEAFGVVGPNGAGKSTILKLLSGIMRPTQGTVQVRGRLSALIEVSAGFHPDLTGRENIYLNGTILGMSRVEIRRRFDAIVAFAELEEFLDTPVKRYSSGMFARLGFAVAAHVEPDLLVVDEVLSVGDYVFQQKCLTRMNEILTSGATVVFVSHNLRAVTTLCSRALLMERGRVAEIGPADEVIKTYLTRAQLTREVDPTQDLRIVEVSVSAPDAPSRVTFETDDIVEITVRATAVRAQHDVSVVIGVVDASQYPVFDTCTRRLGAGPISFQPGDTVRCTFRLQLRLAQGTYHVHAYLHRYVTDRPFDFWPAAATFFVAGTPTAGGVANLTPSLLGCEKEAEAPGPTTMAPLLKV